MRETNYESSNSQPEQLSKSQKINTATSTRAAQITILKNRAKEALGAQQFEQVFDSFYIWVNKLGV